MTNNLEDEIKKELATFQDYTASWGFPMNQEAHERGLKLAAEKLCTLINQKEKEARIDELEEYMLNHEDDESFYAFNRIKQLKEELKEVV